MDLPDDGLETYTPSTKGKLGNSSRLQNVWKGITNPKDEKPIEEEIDIIESKLVF